MCAEPSIVQDYARSHAANPGPQTGNEQVCALQASWLADSNARAGRVPEWLRLMKRRWALNSLASCEGVVVRRRDGSAFEEARREAALLNVSRTWIDFIFDSFRMLFPWLTPHIINLCTSSVAGEGLNFSAWRGVYCDIPFIVKVPHPTEAAQNEWAALTSRLPGDPIIASSLPIATYFGLFRSEAVEFILTSDNGVALNQLVGGYEHLQ